MKRVIKEEWIVRDVLERFSASYVVVNVKMILEPKERKERKELKMATQNMMIGAEIMQ
jgi:hypothetical protein